MKIAKFNTCKMIIIPKLQKNVPVNNSHLEVKSLLVVGMWFVSLPIQAAANPFTMLCCRTCLTFYTNAAVQHCCELMKDQVGIF